MSTTKIEAKASRYKIKRASAWIKEGHISLRFSKHYAYGHQVFAYVEDKKTNGYSCYLYHEKSPGRKDSEAHKMKADAEKLAIVIGKYQIHCTKEADFKKLFQMMKKFKLVDEDGVGVWPKPKMKRKKKAA